MSVAEAPGAGLLGEGEGRKDKKKDRQKETEKKKKKERNEKGKVFHLTKVFLQLLP